MLFKQGLDHLVEIGIALHAFPHRVDGVHDGAVVHVLNERPMSAKGAEAISRARYMATCRGSEDGLLPGRFFIRSTKEMLKVSAVMR